MLHQPIHTDVLIIGAGPAGLSMGIALAHHGIHSMIIEKRSKPMKTAHTILFKPLTLCSLEHLGVIDEILERGHILKGTTYFSNLEYMTHIDFQNSPLPYPFAISLPQSEAEEILTRQYLVLGGRILWNHELIDLSNLSHSVEAKTYDHHFHQQQHLSCHYWIAADGYQSVTRKFLKLQPSHGVVEQKFLIADLILRWRMPTHEVLTFFSKQGSLSMIQLPNDYTRVIADVTRAPHPLPPSLLKQLQILLNTRTPFPAIISQPTWSTQLSIIPYVQDTFYDHPIFFIGNAAHAFSLVNGFGLNLGIHDALNLAWKLALVIQGNASSQLLLTYQHERQPIALHLFTRSLFRSKQISCQPFWLQKIRNRACKLLKKNPEGPLKRLVEIEEMAFHYAQSSIVQGGGELALAYLHILSNQKHLLIGNRLEGEKKFIIESEIAKRYEHVMSCSINEFPGEPSDLLVIRPDHYVGFRSKKANLKQLYHYLDATFSKPGEDACLKSL